MTPEHEALLAPISSALVEAHVVETSDGLDFRWVNPDGTVVVQSRPDDPVDPDVKYLFPHGCELPLGVPVGMEARLADPSKPLVIVEGTKQYLAAASAALDPIVGKPEYAVVGIGGCWNWVQNGSPFRHWRDIPLEGRTVFVAFDADVTSNRNVYDAAERLGGFLQVAEGTEPVRWVFVTGGPEDGFDDLLRVARNPVATFHRVMDSAQTSLGRRPGLAANRAFDPIVVADQILSAGMPMVAGGDNCVLVYRGGQYHNGASKLFDSVAQRVAGAAYSLSRQKDVENVVITRLMMDGRRAPLFQKQLLIPFLNGLLDPMTMTLHPHTPDFVTTRLFQVDWDESAVCPFYEQWTESQMLPGALEDLEEVVSQMFDLTRAPLKGGLLFGPSRSGKGTFSRLVEHVAGQENTSAVSLHDMAKDKFAAADMFGKALNIYSDLSADEVADLSLLKMALGEDLIRAQRKFGQPFEFTNTALMLFAANEVPPVSESSQAYFARIKPFAFPTTFLGKEDPTVMDKLLAELPGIAVRWVNALVRRLHRGRFLPTHADTDRTFRTKSDRVAEFIEEFYERDADARIPGKAVYEKYKDWAVDNRQGVLGRNRFYDRVANVGVLRFERQERPYFGLRERRKGEGSAGTFSTGTNPPTQTDHFPSSHARDAQNPQNLTPLPFDLETVGLDFHGADQSFITAVGTPELVDRSAGRVVQAVSDGRPIVAHNGFNFDFAVLAHTHGLDYLAASEAGLLVDSKVLAILNDPPSARMSSPARYYGLDATAQRLAGIGKTGDVKKMARKYGGFDQIPFDVLEPYCAGDVHAMDEIMARLDMDDYAAREMRLMGRLGYAMRLVGWRVDTALVASHVRAGQARLDAGRSVLAEHGFPKVTAGGGTSSKPHATAQGNEALKAALAATGVKPESWMFTDTGKVTTSKDVWTPERVAALPEQARLVIDTILDMNGVRTVYGTVEDNRVGDRVFPTVMPYQVSGRFSIQNPGLTVMGKRGGKHKERGIFLPEPGELLVAFDLNQVDARAVAMHCQDANYVALFTDPSIDSHAEIAHMVWGDRSRRDEAKAIGHGWNYGEGLPRIARDAGVDMGVVEEFDRQMRVRFPRLVEWQGEVREQAQSGALMDNGMGRTMRPTPDRSHTQGPALLGQGLARDLLMEGLLALPIGYVPMLRGVVHDELVFSVPAGEVDGFVEDVLSRIQFEHRGVPVTAGLVGVGKDWGEVYEKEGK